MPVQRIHRRRRRKCPQQIAYPKGNVELARPKEIQLPTQSTPAAASWKESGANLASRNRLTDIPTRLRCRTAARNQSRIFFGSISLLTREIPRTSLVDSSFVMPGLSPDRQKNFRCLLCPDLPESWTSGTSARIPKANFRGKCLSIGLSTPT